MPRPVMTSTHIYGTDWSVSKEQTYVIAKTLHKQWQDTNLTDGERVDAIAAEYGKLLGWDEAQLKVHHNDDEITDFTSWCIQHLATMYVSTGQDIPATLKAALILSRIET